MQTLESKPQKSSLSLDERIEKICRDLAKLDPGPLAELRRMDTTSEHYGAPYFWRLCARYNLAYGGTSEQTWSQVIQVLAILTPKGRDEHKPSRHTKRGKTSTTEHSEAIAVPEVDNAPTPRRGLGHALCDGGERNWRPEDPTNPRPMFSETRFAKLLGSSGDARVDLVLRLARLLAARLPAEAAFDCTDFARLLIYPDDPSVGRKIARDYYTRLDGARRSEADDNETKNSTGDES